jgi:hypothetical protein
VNPHLQRPTAPLTKVLTQVKVLKEGRLSIFKI